MNIFNGQSWNFSYLFFQFKFAYNYRMAPLQVCVLKVDKKCGTGGTNWKEIISLINLCPG